MSIYEKLVLPDNGEDAISLRPVDKAGYEDWFRAQPDFVRQSLSAQKFEAAAGTYAVIPGYAGDDWSAIFGVADRGHLDQWSLAKLSENLPAGKYRLVDADLGDAMLGWMLGQYVFDEYRSEKKDNGARILLVKEAGKIAQAAIQAEGTSLVRDLVNRPAADMGPAALEMVTKKIAKAHKAECHVVTGHDLENGYPLIHAVGRAASREFAPRLIEMVWGDPRHPRVALVGKGVAFDSGGLDMKSATGMRLMKKDMGGAAHALALAEMIMKSHLPVRLHLLIAAVENAVSGNAMRPGDIIKSRKGITVEIDNTDAEGRLVLADAMTRAVEEKADLMIDFATLTGAARVALGPDLPALFSNQDDMADAILAAGRAQSDPLWQLPLWTGYDDMLASDIADTANSGGGFAGAITAALFLRKFVPADLPWAHVDTFAWRPSAKPGRPKGGEALGLRAMFGYLAQKFPPR